LGQRSYLNLYIWELTLSFACPILGGRILLDWWCCV
jgi:hypothetical protein